jgi:hypothetical protein
MVEQERLRVPEVRETEKTQELVTAPVAGTCPEQPAPDFLQVELAIPDGSMAAPGKPIRPRVDYRIRSARTGEAMSGRFTVILTAQNLHSGARTRVGVVTGQLSGEERSIDLGDVECPRGAGFYRLAVRMEATLGASSLVSSSSTILQVR